MKPSSTKSPSHRIAVLWLSDTLQGQRVMSALYRWAGLMPELAVRQFDVSASRFDQTVVKPLLEWQPHGIVVRTCNWDRLRKLRCRLPQVPFVATHVTPPGLVNTNVVVDITEAITLARDHFHSRGLSHVALFCSNSPLTAPTRVNPFRSVLPDGQVLVHELFDADSRGQSPARTRRIVGDWLHSLPKPVGILTLENHAARFLVGVCQRLRLAIPRDIQIIGVDDVDDCLACEPHLSSLELPSERIGELAMETLLQYLRRKAPPPPPVIRVTGSTLIARGSTGLTAIGDGKIAAVMRQIQSDATKGLSAARVVKQSHLSHTTLYKHFRRTTGTTPAKQLRQTRLKEVCRMLAETNASVTEIANACGFSSPDYLAHFFRRETGQTPTAYRQQRRRGARRR